MNSKVKSKITILLILGILFAFIPITTATLSLIAGNSSRSSEYSDNFNKDNKNLQPSKISGPIYIDDTDPNYNWSVAKDAGICTGNGIYSDPYVIEDLVIDGGGWGSCIVINNSDVYFIIRNCKLYKSGPGGWDAGIGVHGTFNGVIINNNCSSNWKGIYLMYSNYITILGNTANDNHHQGIFLISSNNNIISGNTANGNSNDGINLFEGSNNNNVSGNTANNNYYGISLNSDYNTISGNTANDNYRGISLTFSNYNKISGNTANANTIGIFFLASNNNYISGNTLLGNDECIVEKSGCEGNVFENNDCGIPLVLIILISSISGGAVIGIVTFLLLRRKRKRIT